MVRGASAGAAWASSTSPPAPTAPGWRSSGSRCTARPSALGRGPGPHPARGRGARPARPPAASSGCSTWSTTATTSCSSCRSCRAAASPTGCAPGPAAARRGRRARRPPARRRSPPPTARASCTATSSPPTCCSTTQSRPHLADFGVATARDATAGLTGGRAGRSGRRGSWPRSRPGASRPARPADVFSLGATLRWALTGVGPVRRRARPTCCCGGRRGARSSAARGRCRPSLRHRIDAMLEPRPERRPTAAALAGGPDGTRRPAGGRAAAPPAPRARWPVVGAVRPPCAIAVALAVAVADGAAAATGAGDPTTTATSCVAPPYQPCGAPTAPCTDGSAASTHGPTTTATPPTAARRRPTTSTAPPLDDELERQPRARRRRRRVRRRGRRRRPAPLRRRARPRHSPPRRACRVRLEVLDEDGERARRGHERRRRARHAPARASPTAAATTAGTLTASVSPSAPTARAEPYILDPLRQLVTPPGSHGTGPAPWRSRGAEHVGVTFALAHGGARRRPGASRSRRCAAELGYGSFWTAETTGPEAFSLLAAAGAAAPGIGLGTGVLALQLRTPMVVAMAGATLQALHPDADILLGVGISSPVVTVQVARRALRRPPARPGARVRHAGRRSASAASRSASRATSTSAAASGSACASARSGPKVVVGALNPQMLRAGRRGRRRRAAQLPPGVARAVVGRAGRGQAAGDAHDLRLRARRRVRAGRRHRARPPRPVQLRRRRRLRRATSSGPASATTSPRSASAHAGRRPRRRARRRERRRWSTPSTSWATPTTSRRPCRPTSTPASRCPIVMPLPWGPDRMAVDATSDRSRRRSASSRWSSPARSASSPAAPAASARRSPGGSPPRARPASCVADLDADRPPSAAAATLPDGAGVAVAGDVTDEATHQPAGRHRRGRASAPSTSTARTPASASAPHRRARSSDWDAIWRGQHRSPTCSAPAPCCRRCSSGARATCCRRRRPPAS